MDRDELAYAESVRRCSTIDSGLDAIQIRAGILIPALLLVAAEAREPVTAWITGSGTARPVAGVIGTAAAAECLLLLLFLIWPATAAPVLAGSRLRRFKDNDALVAAYVEALDNTADVRHQQLADRWSTLKLAVILFVLAVAFWLPAITTNGGAP